VKTDEEKLQAGLDRLGIETVIMGSQELESRLRRIEYRLARLEGQSQVADSPVGEDYVDAEVVESELAVSE
jgi:hypothetical protein